MIPSICQLTRNRFPDLKDFAYARNLLAEEKEDDIVMIIDDDEYIPNNVFKEIDDLDLTKYDLVYVRYYNYNFGKFSAFGIHPIIYNKKKYKWIGKIDERLKPIVNYPELKWYIILKNHIYNMSTYTVKQRIEKDRQHYRLRNTPRWKFPLIFFNRFFISHKNYKYGFHGLLLSLIESLGCLMK